MAKREPTVLCVDDETAILNSLRRVFLDEPWETLLATSAEEGLRIVSERDVDLVLADFRMPKMDGVEFLKCVKKVRPDCLRVVLSGYADINLIITALNEGQIYKFLTKPWNDDELRHNVRKLLDHGRLNRENRRLLTELQGLSTQLGRGIQAMASEKALRFAQLALESLPVALVGVDGRGEIFLRNAKARELPEYDEALAHACAAAADAARYSSSGCHVETVDLGGGQVVIAATSDPAELFRPGAPAPAEARS